ncbi:MAG: M23 family metallopeptidase [Eubacteriaceae bacterium]|nr:M23 family metallopeptidase [Eubacteriaceae bacterium]
MLKNIENRSNNKTVIYSIFTILVFLLLVTVAGTKIIQDKNASDKLSQLENSQNQDLGRDGNIADETANANAGTNTNTDKSASASTNTATKTVSLTDISSPVAGKEITMAYSFNTTPVYSTTLGEYRSDHMGADISAKAGDSVKAVLDGKVEKIYDDAKLGKCVVINHGNNIKTVYGNLDATVNVKEGQSVTKGTVIGKVGTTAKFEVDDAPHVHFEIWQNGKTVDPAKYIK